MSPVNSRRKGAGGERELAKRLTELGLPATRGQQFKGGSESPDVVCEALRDKGYHIECKRMKDCKMFSPATLAEWDEQAKRDALGGEFVPVIIHRWNGSRQWWCRVHREHKRPYWQPLEDWLTDLGLLEGPQDD